MMFRGNVDLYFISADVIAVNDFLAQLVSRSLVQIGVKDASTRDSFYSLPNLGLTLSLLWLHVHFLLRCVFSLQISPPKLISKTVH